MVTNGRQYECVHVTVVMEVWARFYMDDYLTDGLAEIARQIAWKQR